MLQKYKAGFWEIIGYLRAHLKEDFHIGYYLFTAGFLLLSLFGNYYLLPDRTVERWITDHYYGREICILWYMAFYGIPYLIIVGAYAWFHKQGQLFRSREFWIKALFGIFVLSLDASFYYYRSVVSLAENGTEAYIYRKIAGNLISFVAMWIPLLLFKKYWDKKQESFYGLTMQGFKYQPYVIMLLIMVPIVLAASFGQEFIDYYPTLRPSRAAAWTALPQWLTMAIYETIYLLDFIWTELIFRGFLVIGMAAVLGKGSVWPMATVYLFRHFAKPFGESVGSIFGGYILGVIALRSRNIMGGVFIHMGVAFLMELFAILQHIIR